VRAGRVYYCLNADRLSLLEIPGSAAVKTFSQPVQSVAWLKAFGCAAFRTENGETIQWSP
jgi:hypothetical protein